MPRHLPHPRPRGARARSRLARRARLRETARVQSRPKRYGARSRLKPHHIASRRDRMTRSTNARIAGFTFLFYIAVAFPSMVLMNRATTGTGIAATLASIAQHGMDVRVAVVLSLLGSFAALVLAVTLWAITRDQDPDLAMLGLTCRVTECITGAVSTAGTVGLLWLATASGPSAPDPAGAQAIGAFLLQQGPLLPATFFAVGSTLF